MDKTDHTSTLDESISEWTGALCFPNTYPLDSDLSGGQRYPTFEPDGRQESIEGRKDHVFELTL